MKVFTQSTKLMIVSLFSVLGLLISASTVHAAPKSELIPFWNKSDESNKTVIDHSDWQYTLDTYLDSQHASGVNLFNYGKVSKADRARLQGYLKTLTSLDPRSYSKQEQFAYWVNLYNALTVELILENYPVDTITDLGESFFGFGPWNDEITKIQGKKLTLNNIEHNILRPIWNDARIHYAVNCASFSCPNVAAKAFTSENTEALLEAAASDYVNHERGVTFDDGELLVSSIYHWYKIDFGGNDQSLIAHLAKYAKPELRTKLQQYKGDLDHHYDWGLNQP